MDRKSTDQLTVEEQLEYALVVLIVLERLALQLAEGATGTKFELEKRGIETEGSAEDFLKAIEFDRWREDATAGSVLEVALSGTEGLSVEDEIRVTDRVPKRPRVEG